MFGGSEKRPRKPPVFRPAGAAHCSVPRVLRTLFRPGFLPYSLCWLRSSAVFAWIWFCSFSKDRVKAVPRVPFCAHCSVPSILLKLAQELCSFCLDLVLQFFQRSCQGGATGPGLKSRSCRTASGTGGLVSRPLGSPEPLTTGSACFSRVSELWVARTVIES